MFDLAQACTMAPALGPGAMVLVQRGPRELVLETDTARAVLRHRGRDAMVVQSPSVRHVELLARGLEPGFDTGDMVWREALSQASAPCTLEQAASMLSGCGEWSVRSAGARWTSISAEGVSAHVGEHWGWDFANVSSAMRWCAGHGLPAGRMRVDVAAMAKDHAEVLTGVSGVSETHTLTVQPHLVRVTPHDGSAPLEMPTSYVALGAACTVARGLCPADVVAMALGPDPEPGPVSWREALHVLAELDVCSAQFGNLLRGVQLNTTGFVTTGPDEAGVGHDLDAAMEWVRG